MEVNVTTIEKMASAMKAENGSVPFATLRQMCADQGFSQLNCKQCCYILFMKFKQTYKGCAVSPKRQSDSAN